MTPPRWPTRSTGRLHDDTVAAEAPTVTAGRGHRIGVGDLIISRRNDPTIGVFDATDITKPADPVRNGNRWRVYAIDTEHNRHCRPPPRRRRPRRLQLATT